MSKISFSDVIDVDAEGALHHVDLELVVGAREGEASSDAELRLVSKEF